MKKTKWFPAHIKPVRAGRYEVRGAGLTAAPFRYFDGKEWRAGWQNEIRSIFGTLPSHEWRGLTEQPK